MSKRLASLLITGLLSMFAVPAQTCFACSCVSPPTPSEAAARSAATFRGRVTAIERENATLGRLMGYRYQRVTFQVDTVWNGQVGREAVVFTGSDDGNCGYRFEQGAEYLVYADTNNGDPTWVGFATGSCDRTRPIDTAADDLAALGQGAPPAVWRLVPPNPLALGAAAVMLIGAAWLLRSRLRARSTR